MNNTTKPAKVKLPEWSAPHREILHRLASKIEAQALHRAIAQMEVITRRLRDAAERSKVIPSVITAVAEAMEQGVATPPECLVDSEREKILEELTRKEATANE